MADHAAYTAAVARGARARAAHSYLAQRQGFSDYTRTRPEDREDMQTSVVDAVADLLIFAAAHDLNPAAILRMATDHARI